MTLCRAFAYLLSSSLLACTLSAETVQRYQREIQVSPEGVLELAIDTGGTVRVESWERDAVSVRAEVTGNDPDAAVVTTEETDSGIRVHAGPRGSGPASYSLSVDIMVPRSFGVEARSRGGDIEVRGLDGPVRGHAVGGDLRVERVTGEVDLRVEGGDAYAVSTSGSVKETAQGGDVTADLTATESEPAPISVDAAGGDAHLILPAAYSARLDLELVYTEDSSRSFEITSDFPLDLEESDWDRSRDPARKTIRGSATLGEGERSIKVEVLNGDIFVRKGD